MISNHTDCNLSKKENKIFVLIQSVYLVIKLICNITKKKKENKYNYTYQ
jgi:hypothetical protein